MVVRAGALSRAISIDGSQLRTVQLANHSTSATLQIDQGEFRLKLLNGAELTAADYRVVQHSRDTVAGQDRLSVQLAPSNPAHPSIAVEYAGDSHVLRKRLVVEGKTIVDRVDVERLRVSATPDLGGFGQPLFLSGSWFAGLEYPAGYNEWTSGWLTCTHYPGRASFTTPWALIGGKAEVSTTIQDGFERYLDAVRQPARPSLQYNTWFDHLDDEITPEALIRTFEHFRTKLLDPFSLRFDAFVVDDGYQNPDSLWECSEHWPDGFAPLARKLEQHGSRLGLWLALNGYNLNSSWGARRGFEKSDHHKGYYCLAGPTYRKALEAAIEKRIRDGNLSYLKHDFNYLDCSADGHGHPATERHGREANVNAQIELMQLERRLQPGIFLNVTSKIWPSPWWLLYADALWMGGADYAHDWQRPVWSDRDAEMTYRDAQLYRVLRIDRAQIPVSALMTHGIIFGRHHGGTPRQTLREWSDHVVFFLGRGTMLHELYLTPELLSDDHWQVLGHALRWSRENAETLRHTRMIGGRPESGDVYGYSHWSAEKGIVCVRNPSNRETATSLPLERPADSLNSDAWHPVLIYPWRQVLPPIDSTSLLRLQLPAGTVAVVELYPKVPDFLKQVGRQRFDVDSCSVKQELVTFADLPPIVPRLLTRGDEERKAWSASYRIDGDSTVASAFVENIREPASGVVAELSASSEIAAGEWRDDPKAGAWDIERRAVTLRSPTDLHASYWLPPSPFYPERVFATLRLQITRKSPVVARLPINQRAPAWPILVDVGQTTESTILLDRKFFDRRRSKAESIGWVLLLGTVPLACTCWFGNWLANGGSTQRRFLIHVLLLTGLTACYCLTPLGSALGAALR